MVESQSIPILTTKFTAPPAHAATISRPRLTARLDAGLAGKLTLISAPPGFGKTTLVTEWLSTYSMPERVAWLSLDPGDSDAGRFLTYFVSALRTVERELGPGLLNVLQAPVQGDATALLVDVINALNRIDEQIICVLDDYHAISSEEVDRALSYLLEHQPSTLHLIITTRETPSLPLALIRSRRDLSEFRTEDLRFTVEETGHFLNRVMGLALSPDQVQRLEQRTEGWIAGLLLAALSAEETGSPSEVLDNFGGEQRYVFDYLAEEVLRRQTKDVQAFLNRTSVLDRMTAELTRELTGEGQERLDYLVESNLFTLPLDTHRSWYRYHHLFGQFLSARYRERDPRGWADAHRKASLWFVARDHQYEAAEHALAADDLERLAELLGTSGREFVRRGRIPTMDRWLSSLPDEMIAARPNLILSRIWTLMLSRQYETIPDWFQRIDLNSIEDERERQEIRAHLAVCEATYARFRADVGEIIDRSLAALEYFATLPGGIDPNECVALLHLGSALRMDGETLEAVERLSQAIELGQPGTDLVVEINAMSQLSAAYGELGRFGEAESWARETLDREREYGIRRLAMSEAARLTLAGILREREAYDEARELLDDAFEAIRVAGDREDMAAQVLYFYLRALIEVGQGDAEAARRTVEMALERAAYLRFPADAIWRVEGLQAWIHLLIGDLELPARWVEERDFPDAEPVANVYERGAIAYAWVDLEMGRIDRAEALLQRVVASMREADRTYRLAEARLVLAALYMRTGRAAEAEVLVDQVVDFAARQNCRRLLIDTHPDIAGMLPGARRRAREGDQMWPLGDELSEETGQRPDQSALIEPLTPRELEVLGLLREGIPNRAIAERLFVSLGTIKRHTHNIYGKLGVNNRTQAIIRGQELGLIEVETFG